MEERPFEQPHKIYVLSIYSGGTAEVTLVRSNNYHSHFPIARQMSVPTAVMAHVATDARPLR